MGSPVIEVKKADRPGGGMSPRLAVAFALLISFLLICVNRGLATHWLNLTAAIWAGARFASLASLGSAMAAHVKVVGLALALSGLWHATGLGLVLGGRKSSRFTDSGWRWTAIGSGWALMSFTWFGCSLVGLFYPVVLLGVALALGAKGVALVVRRGPHSAMLPIPQTKDLRLWGMGLLVVLPILVMSPFLMVPPTYVDFYQYHMAAPEHFLKMHRFALEGKNHGFHLQMSAELLNAWGIMAKSDAVAVFIGLIPFLAALGYLGHWIGSYDEEAAVLAVGFGLLFPAVSWVCGAGGNDLASAAFCLYALVAQGQRKHRLAALSWGVACATKINGLPFAAVAWGWQEGQAIWRRRQAWRPDFAWLAIWFLSAGAWLTKEWILKGDPQWPMFEQMLGGKSRNPHLHAALASLMGSDGGWTVQAYATALWETLSRNMPVILVALPLMACRPSRIPGSLREVALMAVVSYGGFSLGYRLMIHYEFDRLALPLMVLWGSVAALAIGHARRALPRWGRAVLAPTMLVVLWVPLGDSLGRCYDSRSSRYVMGGLTGEQLCQAQFTTAWEARQSVSVLPGLRTLLLIDDHAAYRWPGKVETEEFFDQSPTWLLTREANDLPRMLIRCRQRNVTHLAFNLVREMAVAAQGAPYVAYEWNLRQLGLLRNFMRDHTRVVLAPVHCDSANGAYYVHELVTKPLSPPSMVSYLPGVKQLTWWLLQPTAFNECAIARQRTLEMAALLPDVAQFQLILALIAMRADDWEEASRRFKGLSRSGIVWEFGHGVLANAALHAGRPEEAIEAVRQGRTLYPTQQRQLDQLEGAACALMSARLLNMHQSIPQALAYAQRAIGLDPDNVGGEMAFVEASVNSGLRQAAADRAEWIARRWPTRGDLQNRCTVLLQRVDRTQAR